MDVKYQSSLRINVKAFKAGRSLYLFYAPHAVVFIQKHYPVIRKNYLLCVGALYRSWELSKDGPGKQLYENKNFSIW